MTHQNTQKQPGRLVTYSPQSLGSVPAHSLPISLKTIIMIK